MYEAYGFGDPLISMYVFISYQIIEWLPYSHTNAIQVQHSKSETLPDSDAKTSTVTNFKARKR